LLRPGETLDWFRIEALLGQGGMGAVYQALDTRLDRRVALKVLSVSGAIDPTLLAQARARLLREARAAAAIAHPNAVAIHHVGDVEGDPYIVMELLDGETLREVMTSDAPVEARLRWLTEVADALSAAHVLGIVHRDVKPDNVMILRSGRAKVLDFGIARRELSKRDGAEAPHAPLTTPGLIVGTPAYLAPEQIQGEVADARSDQFAWGVTAFEVLAGELPWGSVPDPIVLLGAILLRPVPDLATRCPAAPPGAVAIIQRALSRERDARFASMSELVDALGAIAATGGAGATTNRVTVRPVPASVRALGTAKTEAVATPPIATASTAKPPDAAALRPRRAAVVVAGAAVALALAAALGVVRLRGARQATSSPIDAATESDALAPRPVSAVPAAVEAYESGLDAYRHRSLAQAMVHFERAIELDPRCVAAEARLAALELNPVFPPLGRSVDTGRHHLSEARRGIEQLSPRDRGYLLAHEPLALQTQDVAVFETRASELAREYPNDAEVIYLLSTAQRAAQRQDDADATDARVVELDPSFGPAYRGVCRAKKGETSTQVLACFDGCLDHAKASGPCHDGRATTLTKLGRCNDLAEEGRAWDAVDPEHWGGLLRLTDALFAQGGSLDDVRDALRRTLAKSPRASSQAERPRAIWLGANGDIATGDFDGAVRELHRYAVESPGPESKMAEVGAVADALQESGRTADARKEIEEASRLSSAWTAAEQARFASLDLRAAHIDWLAGRLSRAEYVRKRDALAHREAEESRSVRAESSSRYPTPLSPEDAKDLLAVAATPAAAKDFDPGLLGEAHLRAGDVPAALSLLRKGLAPCAGIEGAVRALHLHALLGEALERSGDPVGAKHEYDRVLAFWGTASPRSVTADAVRARSNAKPHR
jgi:eukaryotic-like serine/threonine-protein kinase